MRHFLSNISPLLFVAAFSLTSCLSDGDDTIVLEDGNTTGIPSDELAGQNPDIGSSTTTIPNIQYTVENEGGDAVVRIDMTGIQDAGTYDWLRLIGTAQDGQNVWVSVDGKPKGISVTNNSDSEGDNKTKADLVFLVDNSGSMSDEADAIARDITSWAQKLQKSNLDIRFGCVGYGSSVGSQYNYLVDNYGVSGALDIAEYTELNNYLNGRKKTGTSRTVGYYGSNSSKLQTAASQDQYNKAGGECGVQALKFANENFKFRSGSNRIYVNFTDDANFPGGSSLLSINYIKSNSYWTTDKGTIHSVISNDTTSLKSRRYGEIPWALSWFTGGTIITAPSNFSGVTLESLPVTGAMQNSYVIRFTNVSEFMDGKTHKVTITVLSADGKTRAEKTFYIVFGTAD